MVSIFYLVFNKKISHTKAGEEDDIIISSNTSWAAGNYTYRDITITNNSVLTLQGSYTNDSDGYGVTISARNIIIDAGSSVSTTMQGYGTYTGTGKPATSDSFAGGAGYGGTGGIGRFGDAGGTTYGSTMNPTDLGSGAAAAGGGAMVISCDSISIAGNIEANGSGGGSGGTINIQTIAITGAGSIFANGGDNSTSYRGGGGGGRVAIYYSSSSSTFNFANVSVNGGIGKNNGSVGTVFSFDTETKNLNVSSDLTLEADQGLDQNGNLTTDGVYYFNNLTVSNNATLLLNGKYTNDTNGSGTLLNIAGDVTIETNASISAQGLGYSAQDGQGSGVDGNGGSGGGYGGIGGNSVDQTGGTTYGSALFPADLGSGGGNWTGGSGGGLIKMVIAGDIEIQASAEINASGNGGYVDGTTEGGGGSGGSIYLVFDSISGSGTISSNGGAAPNFAGGGGGGRIALFGNTSSYDTSNISVAGGTCGGSCTAGINGTIFVYDTLTGNVEVSNDLTLEANQGVNPDGSSNTDGIYYFNNLQVTNNSTLTLGGYYTNDTDGRGVTLNLDGNLTIDSGSYISANGQGYAARHGQGAGYGSNNEAGSGGTHGGTGGISADNGVNPNTYGNELAPYYLGSGSGIENNGVAGGGAAIIRCLGNAIVNGALSANGADGVVYLSSWASGGGSGGSIFLSADNISGSGTIGASGGAGGGAALGGGGGGGGGRVAVVYYSSNSFPEGNIIASGGAGSVSPDRNGSDGTVNIIQKSLPNKEFRLKNPNNNSYQYTNSLKVDIVPESLSVTAYYEDGNLPPTMYADGWHQVSEGKNLAEGEGEKFVTAWLKDNNELIASNPSTASITVDTTNPALNLSIPGEAVVLESSITISGTVSDNLSGIEELTYQKTSSSPTACLNLLSLNKATNVTINPNGTFSQQVGLIEGVNKITFTLTDRAGNIVSDSLEITMQASEEDGNYESVDDSTGGQSIQSDLNNDIENKNKENEKIKTPESNSATNENEDKNEDIKRGTNYYVISLIIIIIFLSLVIFYIYRNRNKYNKS